jgi:hypothetical protein
MHTRVPEYFQDFRSFLQIAQTANNGMSCAADDIAWGLCAPHYSQTPINLFKRLRSMVAVRTFVSVFYKEGEEETRKIFEIVSYEATMVTLNEFALFAGCNLSRAPIVERPGNYLNEVVMTLSLELFESATLNLQVALVMSEQELQAR